MEKHRSVHKQLAWVAPSSDCIALTIGKNYMQSYTAIDRDVMRNVSTVDRNALSLSYTFPTGLSIQT